MSSRIVVADSVALFRVGVRVTLERVGGFVVEEASNEQELLAILERGDTDLVLLDLHLEPFGGASTLQQVVAGNAALAVVWALSPKPDEVLAALSAGATGFLTKDMETEVFVRSLHDALEGQAPVSPRLLTGLVRAVQRRERRERFSDRSVRLSAREREVLGLVSSGARNREIAEFLAISEFTVKRHVQNILHKLNVQSREGAADIYRTVFDIDNTPLLAAPA